MSDKARETLLLVGIFEEMHVGRHLLEAAREEGYKVETRDSQDAFRGPLLVRAFSWRILGRRPPRLSRFSREILDACRELRPRWLLTTGMAPVRRAELDAIGRLGIRRLAYLTDDPWNPAHHSRWFLEALVGYDTVCTTRKANMDDLAQNGCGSVRHVPFGYSPRVHFRADGRSPRNDVVFIGGADGHRLDFVLPLIREGLDVSLYGGYWQDDPETRKHWKGFAGPEQVREAVADSKVTPCLVRRANRDGTSMRSFEVPAMGGCVLAEETEEHRALFGPEDEAARYFSSPKELLEKTRRLLGDPESRVRLADASHARVAGGHHTYRDRLRVILADE